MDETDKDARIEALEAEVAALKAQVAVGKRNQRVVARSLAGLVSGLLSAEGDE